MRSPLPWTPPDPLPGPILTPRTLVRWWAPDDAPGLYEAVEGAREALLPWLPWARHEHGSEEESRMTIERFTHDRADPACRDFVMGVFDRATGAVLGGTGVHRIEPAWRTCEVGYWIRGGMQRRGYCTETTAALISAAFGPWAFRRVTLICSGGNVASRGVAEKLGLRLEGTEKEARWVDGPGWTDELRYAVLDREWDTEAGRAR
jgi:RimJ/RimL family protein N-acetyltransferase